MTGLPGRSATDIADAVRRGETSPVDVVDAHLARIGDRNERTNAFVTVAADRARADAATLERAVERGEDPGPLAGVPVGIKDLCPVAGVSTTFGSRPFADHVSPESAVLVERLEAAGAVVVGKTNACEFGHKGTTDNPLHGSTTTPWRDDRNAGGSSGGSAAAVADGLVPLAQGGDGGGSIRIPASLCGVVGIKPTFGRVPHKARPNAFGEHTPFIDRGPLARSVADAALFLDVVVGSHPADPFSFPDEGTDFVGAADRSIDGLSVGYCPDFAGVPVADEVDSTVREALTALEACGATVHTVDVAFGHDRETVFDAWRTAYEVLNAALVEGLEAEHSVDLVGDHRDEISDKFAALVDAGRKRTALEYKRTDRIRTDVYDALRGALTEYDLIATPTVGPAAVEDRDSETVGPGEVAGVSVDPLVGWTLTYPVNMTGNPAASVPAGYVDAATPVGLQLVGRRHDDESVIAAAESLERERPWTGYLPK